LIKDIHSMKFTFLSLQSKLRLIKHMKGLQSALLLFHCQTDAAKAPAD